MSESYVENTYSGEDEESDALRYKDHPSDYLDFEKGFVSSSPSFSVLFFISFLGIYIGMYFHSDGFVSN
jgi:hypothetical protein